MHRRHCLPRRPPCRHRVRRRTLQGRPGRRDDRRVDRRPLDLARAHRAGPGRGPRTAYRRARAGRRVRAARPGGASRRGAGSGRGHGQRQHRTRRDLGRHAQGERGADHRTRPGREARQRPARARRRHRLHPRGPPHPGPGRGPQRRRERDPHGHRPARPLGDRTAVSYKGIRSVHDLVARHQDAGARAARIRSFRRQSAESRGRPRAGSQAERAGGRAAHRGRGREVQGLAALGRPTGGRRGQRGRDHLGRAGRSAGLRPGARPLSRAGRRDVRERVDRPGTGRRHGRCGERE